jgi:hypothetical protein
MRLTIGDKILLTMACVIAIGFQLYNYKEHSIGYNIFMLVGCVGYVIACYKVWMSE